MIQEYPGSKYTNEQIDLLLKGIISFNQGDYFEAHDLIEEAWQEMKGNPKIFWQAVIQFAVSLYHFSSGNRSGSTGLARKASVKLNSLPAFFFPEVVSVFQELFSSWEKLSQIAKIPAVPPEIVAEIKRIVTPDLVKIR